MDDILRQILEQLQSQGQELKAVNQRLGNLEEGQKDLRRDQQNTDAKLTRLAVYTENSLGEKVKALYDDRSMIHNSLDRIEKKLDRQDERLNQHWQEIQVLKTKRR